MAKLSKVSVKAKIEEYAAALKKLQRAENAHNAEIEPLLEEYKESVKPINAKHEKKIAPLRETVDTLYDEIVTFLETQSADVSIEAAGYVAERKVQTKLLPRLIDVKKFIEVAKKKGEAMYACISVGVKKAEDLLGKEIDQISTRPEKEEVSVTLRAK